MVVTAGTRLGQGREEKAMFTHPAVPKAIATRQRRDLIAQARWNADATCPPGQRLHLGQDLARAVMQPTHQERHQHSRSTT